MRTKVLEKYSPWPTLFTNILHGKIRGLRTATKRAKLRLCNSNQLAEKEKKPMPDYAKMYRHLFNSQTDAIALLAQAQQDTEKMFVEAKEPEIRLLKPEEKQADESENEREKE